LRLLRFQSLFEGLRLHVEFLEPALQRADLRRQVMQFALRGRDRALGVLQLVPRFPARPFGGAHFPAQGIDLGPQ
jgi:hypothetical protein